MPHSFPVSTAWYIMTQVICVHAVGSLFETQYNTTREHVFVATQQNIVHVITYVLTALDHI